MVRPQAIFNRLLKKLIRFNIVSSSEKVREDVEFEESSFSYKTGNIGIQLEFKPGWIETNIVDVGNSGELIYAINLFVTDDTTDFHVDLFLKQSIDLIEQVLLNQ